MSRVPMNDRLGPERRECAIAQTKRIAFAQLRAVDNLARDQVSQRIVAIGQAERAADIVERCRHRRGRVRVESAILQ